MSQTICTEPDCFNLDLTEQGLTDEERRERNEQYKNKGYFQHTVSEVIGNDRITSMQYEGENQFKPKTDEELIAECKLDHLSPEQREITIQMLKRNIDAFQRHPLDIGEYKGLTAFIPLKEKSPPILCVKYVPVPLKYKEAAQKLLDKYVAAGVIARTTDTCQFTSNIFVIPKTNGKFRSNF